MKNLIVLSALLATSTVFAEDAPQTGEPNELAIDQKLARVYDLYRKGDAVSLKPSEMQLDISVAGTVGSKETLGILQSTRGVSSQFSVSRGIGRGTEISLALPLQATSMRAETADQVIEHKTLFGIADPTIRILHTLPTKEVSTTAIFAATLPVGKRELSDNGFHTSIGANWSKVFRPAFVSGGLTWERDWRNRTNGVGYNAGAGFFLNHALSVGGEVSGVAMLNQKQGRTRDNTMLGIKVAYQSTPDFGIIGSVHFGVGTDSPRTTIGISTNWRF